jgi:hypothetical protein
MCAALSGHETLVAHVLVAGNGNSDIDAAFSIRQELIADFA